MNRMFRFNVRKSRHRVEFMMGSSFATTRSDKKQVVTDGSGQKNKQGTRNGKQRSLSNIKTTKNKSTSRSPSPRLVQSETSFDLYDHGDTSETERTVPHVDSSFSQNSDTEKEIVTATIKSITNTFAGDCDSNDSFNDSDDEDIPFLGNVFEFDEDEDVAKDHNDYVDNSIVQLALQASQNILNDASKTCSVNLSLEASAPISDMKQLERLFVQLDQAGNVIVEEGRSEQAVINYFQALHYKREALLLIHEKSPSTCNRNDQNRLVNTTTRCGPKQHVLASIATSINNLAFLLHNQSRIDANETLVLYQIALQIKRHVLGSHHLSVGKTLNNVGSIYYIQREFQLAAQNYEDARTILQLHLGSRHLDVCTVTSNIGDVRCSLQQWRLAAKEYRAALELRWPLYGPSDPKNVRLMEQIAEIEMKINQLNAEKEDLDHVTSISNEKCYGPIIKDVRKLHKEVQRDIDRIDRQLASQLPLEMMKEKIEMYREIRDIATSDSHVDRCAGQDDCTKQISEYVGEKSAAHTNSRLKSFDVVVLSAREHIKSPTTSNRITGRLAPQLTSEERHKALISVKEKLAKLRANRESLSPEK